MPVSFTNNSIQVLNTLNDAYTSWLYEAAGELDAEVKRNSRVDTGQTKGSYSYNVDLNTKTAVIGSNLENAIWEEFGTGEYALHGNGRKGGWLYKDKNGVTRYTLGKKPNRPLERAYNSKKNQLKRRFENILGGM